MSSPNQTAREALTAYEDEQVRQIAAWKSEPTNPFSEMFKRITLPGARVIENVIPNGLVQTAIERAYDLSEVLAGQEDIKRQAGVQDLEDLRHRSLEECDRLTNKVSTGSQVLSTVEGSLTGAGGPLTTLIDIPVLFVLAIRTILKIGHCYGYRLDQSRDRQYVLAVLLAATSNTLQIRRERLTRIRDVEEWLLEEAQEDIVAEEAASFLFQLEVFEDVPGVGAVSGALLNLAFIRKVDITARRVFQERWLRDNGKVDEITPAEAHERVVAAGWTGALSRAAHRGGYYLGFGVTMPAWFLASWFRPLDGALTQGIRNGALGAEADVDRFLGWTQNTAASATAAISRDSAPSLAPTSV